MPRGKGHTQQPSGSSRANHRAIRDSSSALATCCTVLRQRHLPLSTMLFGYTYQMREPKEFIRHIRRNASKAKSATWLSSARSSHRQKPTGGRPKRTWHRPFERPLKLLRREVKARQRGPLRRAADTTSRKAAPTKTNSASTF